MTSDILTLPEVTQDCSDPTKADGTMRKLMDVGRLAQMGWSAGIQLERGLADTYEWYLANIETVRA